MAVLPHLLGQLLHHELGHWDGVADGLAGDPLVPVHLGLPPTSLGSCRQCLMHHLRRVVGRRLSVPLFGHAPNGLLH